MTLKFCAYYILGYVLNEPHEVKVLHLMVCPDEDEVLDILKFIA